MILAFIGVKLVLEFAHKQFQAIPEISTVASLAVITSVVAATTIASVIRSRRTPGRRAQAGSLGERAPTSDPDAHWSPPTPMPTRRTAPTSSPRSTDADDP